MKLLWSNDFLNNFTEYHKFRWPRESLSSKRLLRWKNNHDNLFYYSHQELWEFELVYVLKRRIQVLRVCLIYCVWSHVSLRLLFFHVRYFQFKPFRVRLNLWFSETLKHGTIKLKTLFQCASLPIINLL